MKITIGKRFLKVAFVLSVPLLLVLHCNTAQTEAPSELPREQIGDAPTFPEKTTRDTAKSSKPIKFDKRAGTRIRVAQAVAPIVENQLIADAKLTAHDATYAHNKSDVESSDSRNNASLAFAVLWFTCLVLIARRRARR